MTLTLDEKKSAAAAWFRQLRDQICAEFEAIEAEYATHDATHVVVPPPFGGRLGGGLMETQAPQMPPSESINFTRTPWVREDGGSGEISLMKGRVFEKVGVNISVVQGEFSQQFRHEIPGAAENPTFWAAGISLVAHMASPLVPAAHMNTRMIMVGEPPSGGHGTGAPQRLWFGGGGDLNPMVEDPADTKAFHAAFQTTCAQLDAVIRANDAATAPTNAPPSAAAHGFYDTFTQWCDESRGVGGIFYDYLGLNRFGADTSPVTSGRFGKGGVTAEKTFAGMQRAANANLDWQQGFTFTQNVGSTFADIYASLIRQHMHRPWTDAQRHQQLVKRGRYAEYNLLYDRGTRFGLMTGGNPEAILMSLPPLAIWE
jgi:coproporphyrinogen III oxidase